MNIWSDKKEFKNGNPQTGEMPGVRTPDCRFPIACRFPGGGMPL